MPSALRNWIANILFNLKACFRVYKKLIRKPHSYLRETGWLESLKRGYPCDAAGEELPWMNYAIVAFLQQRLKKNFALFEYGCGYSTIFYSKRVASITAVEHNKSWFDLMQARNMPNVTLLFQEADHDGKYSRAVTLNENKYHVIVIDGIDRVNCLIQSINKLTDDGVILLDDSSRPEYGPGIEYARQKGFLTIDFEGLKSRGNRVDRTTIFYRRNNCFGI